MATVTDTDRVFAGSIPQLYERFMVPMIFEPYAADMARDAAALRPAKVLELAAGTGVVTRRLARELPDDVAIVATDLNPAMLEEAAHAGTARPVQWRPADAMQLPFEDATFDVVACQFGVMFFPDKARAFAEARRVLRPGGTLLFNVWDRIEANEFITVVCGALDELFPENPPRFMHRGPHGYHDKDTIRADLARGGFPSAQVETVAHRSRAARARDAVTGYCHGSPLRSDIEAHGPDALARATEAAVAALEQRFGRGPIEGAIQAHVVRSARG
ncbi:class I SAM-dependent methyltransferase [Ramlibacter sp. PS4R-6]|uniref:class I SAM-dependent methyltransferase n=1 Tax=Ramlibacter sp. PS4R-6 TaxID=3133438 RepID=UPI00309847FF